MQNLKLLLMRSGGQEESFSLGTAQVSLGRATINDIVLPGARVSRTHAHIECGDACVLVDEGSANGTLVNGVRVAQAILKPGDLLTIGDFVLRVAQATPTLAPEVIPLDSEAELESTLAEQALEVTLHNTTVPRLAVSTPSKTWEIELAGTDHLEIGRGAESDLRLEQPKISRQHARIERRGDSFVLRDLGSTNGTWVGGQRIEERVLADGDTFRIGEARLVFKCGFDPEELTLVEPPVGASPRRPVVFVPGYMGSELWMGSERVWPNVGRLFRGPDVFRLTGEQRLEARALVGEVVIVPNLLKQEHYNRIGDFLEEALGYERGKDLLEVPYDWRQDNRRSAQRLAQAIEEWGVREPITLIAHSNGCLVSRYYVEKLGGKKKVERLILLGGPHAGVPKTVSQLVHGPDILPFGLLGERMRGVLATFPSVYQLLPTYSIARDQSGKMIDVLRDESWLAADSHPFLRDARRFREELGTQSSVSTISIFGYGIKTVTQLAVRLGLQGGWESLAYQMEPSGDDLIPEQSAVLEGSDIHPVQQHHGALYVDNDVKMRLKLELTRPSRG